ncbi:hypothetical protein VTO58DRAFT_105104 [Aureobasidium pullulans]
MGRQSESETGMNTTSTDISYDDREVFTNEKNHQIKYRTLSWQSAAFIMITEIVTGGTLTLPQAIAVVGLVPGTIIILFCGIWALFTSFLLINFKLNHPEFFSYLGGIVASAFASWYTYGLAGAFWWHDTHHLGNGWRSVKQRWPMFILCLGTLLAGGFICVGGMYAIVKSLIEAYASGAVGHPFTC